MKKAHIIRGIIVIILVILGWVIFLNKDSLFVSQKEAGAPEVKTEEKVSLIINKGEDSPLVVTSGLKEGMTAFSLLKEKTEELGLTLETKTYDMGIFIEVIGDKKNGQDGKYWMYYVNDELPMVAADKKELNPGDKVEFKFETPSF